MSINQTTTQASTPAADGPSHQIIGEFSSYGDAERLVDTLSDRGFGVEDVRIAGTGLRTVEQVTGRLTRGRAALAGAASGAWFGLLIGFLIGLFALSAAWLAVVLISVVIGSAWGALFGFFAHLATGGRRDFASTESLQASSYAVQVDARRADEAIQLSRGR